MKVFAENAGKRVETEAQRGKRGKRKHTRHLCNN